MVADQPWRFWVTGGLAAVMAAAAQGDTRSGENARTRVSRYSARETVQRIELLARDHGLPLFAKLAPRSAELHSEWLLVLGSDAEHTPVLQSAPGAPLELPLTVRVASDGERGTQVHFTRSSEWLAEQDGVPREMAAQLAALPRLIDAAIG
jgi:uncharacterized protein (DUF302 family)